MAYSDAQGLMLASGMNPYGQGTPPGPYSSYPYLGLGADSPNDPYGSGYGSASGAMTSAGPQGDPNGNPWPNISGIGSGILGNLPGDPNNQAAIGQIQNLGNTALNSGGISNGYTPRSPYGANTYDSSGYYQNYDPSGGMGYGGSVGMQQSGLSFGQQDPAQLAAIAQMYGSNANANAILGGAQYGMQGQIGAAQAGAQGQIGAAQQAANAAQGVAKTQAGSANYLGDLGLKGLQGTNATNLQMNQGNNATQLGLGGLNLQGIQNTNQANQNIAGTQAGAQLGVAGLGLQGTENTNAANQAIANTQAGSANYLGGLNLQGIQGTNLTNQNIAGINSQTQLGLGGLNLQGTQNTNQANQNIAGTQAGAQEQVANTQAQAQNYAALQQALAAMGVAGTQAGASEYGSLANALGAQNVASIQNQPALQKLGLLGNLLGGSAGSALNNGTPSLSPLPQNPNQTATSTMGYDPISGLPLGPMPTQSAGQSGVSAGGGGGGGAGVSGALGNAATLQSLGGAAAAGGLGVPGSGSLDTSGANTPAVGQNQPINAQQMQQNLGAGQAKIDQQIATLRNQLLQKQGANGMNATSSAGGLPAGLEQQLQQQAMQSGMQNNLDWQNYANSTNNQNNLAYSQLGLGQYNAQQNRILQQLALEAPYQQGTASLNSNLLLGLLG